MNARMHHRIALLIVVGLFCAAATAMAQVDCSKITASRGTVATGGMIISGTAGAAAGNSTVTVTDGHGHSVTVKTNADGSFVIKEIDLPEGFDHTIGGTLTVTSGGRSCDVKITR